jgi:NB-ARC domain-containing protein/tetratricopeptide repeat protein
MELPERDVVNAVVGDVSGLVVQAGRIEGGVHYHQHHHAAVRPVVGFPHRAGVVPPRAGAFQERVVSEPVSISDATIVLSGLGGVGKTQLAADLAEGMWAAGQVDLLVWVTAGSREAIMSSYARVAADLTGIEDADPGDGARRLLEWLASTSGRWLVVLDDVQSPGDLRELWPPSSQTGLVVVTTRRQDAALRGHGRRLVEVGAFTVAEAHAHLAAVLAERTSLLDGAAELAAELGFLPLALAQAAAYMLDRNLSCAAYLDRLTDRRRSLATVLPEQEALPDTYRATVAATWSISVEHADRLEPVGVAGPLLEVASLLDANGIPTELFGAPAVVRFLTDRVGRPVSEEEARDGLGCLHRLSLITFDQRTVRVHALVQRATRDDLSDGPLVARVAADALVHVWPEVERDTELAQMLRANTDALDMAGGEHLWEPDGHDVLFRAGRSLGGSGLVGAAVAYFRRLHTTAADHLGTDHPATLAARADIATWRGEAGDEAGAVDALEKVLPDRLRVLGPDHLQTLVTRHDIANWSGRSGDSAGAVRAFEELLPDQVRALGPDHPQSLITRANLAMWRGSAGDPAGALTAFEELLPDQLRVLGADDPLTLITRANIATGRREAGDRAGAVRAFEELLPDQLRVFGPDHPNTLATRQAFASARGEAGDPAGAARVFEELLPDQLRILGPDHPNTLITRHNIAYWRGHAGDPAGAVSAFEQLLPDQLRVLGPDHPYVLATHHALASARGQAGDPAGAVSALETVLQHRVRTLGADHPDTLAIRADIASWRREAGDPSGAIRVLEALLSDQMRVLDPDHPDTLATRAGIAYWRGEEGDLAGAVSAFEALLADQARVLGPDHPDSLTTRGVIAAWRGKTGDLAGAVGWLEALLHDQIRVLGPDHPDIITTRHSIAHWRREAGDTTGALATLSELRRDQVRILGADHPDTLSTRAVIAYIRGEAGDTPGALAALTELLHDQVRVLGSDHPDIPTTHQLIALQRTRL